MANKKAMEWTLGLIITLVILGFFLLIAILFLTGIGEKVGIKLPFI